MKSQIMTLSRERLLIENLCKPQFIGLIIRAADPLGLSGIFATTDEVRALEELQRIGAIKNHQHLTDNFKASLMEAISKEGPLSLDQPQIAQAIITSTVYQYQDWYLGELD